MKRPLQLGTSVALNVVLLASLYALRQHLTSATLPARPLRLASEPAPKPPAVSPPRLPVASAAPAPAPSAPSPSTPFHWSQIASTDYVAYRDHLRAIGCPEATARDILRAEINAHYLARRQPLVTEFQQQYWTLAAAGTIDPADPDDWREDEFERLDDEREQLLKTVLGEDSGEEPTRGTDSQRERWARTYAWLPDEKREALLGLLENHAQQTRELGVAVSRRGGEWTDADRAQRQELNRQFEQARTQLLSPAELDEYRLRGSGGARWTQGLVGFEATEDEWRAVARLHQGFDEAVEQLERASLSAEEKEARREELQASLETETRVTLGAERYAEVQRAQDAQYDTLRRVIRRHGLTDALATTAYEMVKSAEGQMRQVSDKAELPEATRAATLRALRGETEAALRQALGGTAFETYQEYGGGWLREAAPDESP